MGEVSLAGGGAAVFVVENKGSRDLFLKNFPVENPETGQRLDQKPIQPGKKIQLTYFYQPVRLGPFETEVEIRSNDRDRPLLRLPVRGTAVHKPHGKNGESRIQ
jgi:hypothetical protein